MKAAALAIQGQSASAVFLYPSRGSPRSTRGLVNAQRSAADGGDVEYESNTKSLTLSIEDSAGLAVGDRVVINNRSHVIEAVTAGSDLHTVYRVAQERQQ